MLAVTTMIVEIINTATITPTIGLILNKNTTAKNKASSEKIASATSNIDPKNSIMQYPLA
jgi:hypothetical protein